jgi:hypothetical protein
MEIKKDESWEDYCIRKGYYVEIPDVLPPEINPDKFGYLFDVGLEAVIKNERGAFKNGGIYNGTKRYALIDQTITEAQADINIARIRATERYKKKQKEIELEQKHKEIQTTYLNGDFEIRCKRLNELIELIKTPENNIYIKELVMDFVKLKHEYSCDPSFMQIKTIINFEDKDKVKKLKESTSSLLLNDIIIDHEKQHQVNKKAAEDQRKKIWEKVDLDVSNTITEEYKRTYDVVNKYKKKQEVKQKIEELKSQIVSLEQNI